MKLKTAPLQIQKQILAPILQQSIEVLLLPITDLNLAINQELQNNPLLEVREEQPSTQESQSIESLKEQVERIIQRQILSPTSSIQPEDSSLEERPFRQEETLESKLISQLHYEFSDPIELKIGEYIIGNINEEGYLSLSLDDIARDLNIKDLPMIEAVLKIIQRFDPCGIASRSLEECLLNQLHEKTSDAAQLASLIVQHHLHELSQKKFSKIAKALKVSVDKVKTAAGLIASLDPQPARNHRPLPASLYIQPDVYIVVNEDSQLTIQLNRDSIPELRVNAVYKEILKKKNISRHEKEFIQEKLTNAMQFIRSIEQRGNTLYAISQYIAEHQTVFLTQEDGELTPMALKDVAAHIGRNESTVSRAINNKYASTPRGLLPLKFFFTQAVYQNGSEKISNQSIKDEIKELIESEDKSAPLSDKDIQDHFAGKNIRLARRTITKYRKMLRIPASHSRKA